jgi:hypothetical protein
MAARPSFAHCVSHDEADDSNQDEIGERDPSQRRADICPLGNVRMALAG